MATDHIQPQPGRRPVYPVDVDDDAKKETRPAKSLPVARAAIVDSIQGLAGSTRDAASESHQRSSAPLRR